MEACIAAGVQQFVYSSSLLVYEDQVEPIDQDTPATSRLGYGRAKREAEQALSGLAKDSGIKLAMIRLPHVYGARDLMFDQVRQSRVIFPGNGRNLFAHLHVEDAARVLLAAAEQGWQGTSAVADGQAADWNEFFAVIKRFYPRFQSIAIPKSMALLGTYLLTPLRRLNRFPSLYTPDAVRSWNMNLQVKKGLLWNELGIRPSFPSVDVGIPAVLDECVEFRWIHPVADRRG
jgi:nucleoside-diphosphate-sugar epimerase